MIDLYHSRLSQSSYDVVVIGSGLGSLTAANLMAKTGKKVLILERHYVPGGFTHTFRRKDFVWDVGVHYIGQVNKEDSMMRKLFDYLTNGTLEWANMGEVYDKIRIGTDEYDFRSGAENQIEALIHHFPGEEQAIRTYFSMASSMGTATAMYFGEKSMPLWLSKCIGWLLRKKFYRFSDLNTWDALHRLTKNEKLISVLCGQCGNYGLPPKESSFAMQLLISEHYIDGGNYPVGGSAVIAKNILEDYKKRGGVLALKAEVDEILVERNKVTGVRLSNGDFIPTRCVISGVGASNTFNKLLKPNLLPHDFLEKLNQVNPSVAHLCLYVGLDRSDEELELPKHNLWIYKDYDFDSAFSTFRDNPYAKPPLTYFSFPSAKDPLWQKNKPGTSSIQIICAASYDWVKNWENTRWQKRGEDYCTLKEHWKEQLLNELYRVLPQTRGHVVISELSTPLSTKHFSNYANGEIYGLSHTPQRFRMNSLRVHTSIKGLYLTGQDLVTVGVGGAMFSGVLTASSILRKNFLGKALRYKKP